MIRTENNKYMHQVSAHLVHLTQNKNKTTIMTDLTTPLNLSDESEEDENNWQQVPTKRKRCGSPNTYLQKRQHHDNAPSTSNRFLSLDTNEGEHETEDNTVNEVAVPKPPPIFIPNVEDITKMVKNLSKIVPSTDYNYKCLRNNEIRLVVNNTESYRKVINHLDNIKINYHTYQLKQERAFRVVIKGIHHSTPVSDIKAHLITKGHQVRSIRNIVSRITKTPLPMFFVDLDPSPNNQSIFDIRSYENAIIEIEAPRKFDDIVQCYRCQQFGHTKSYCRKPFKCVKCGLGHATTECRKARDSPPQCVHCQGNHTASYRGCSEYRKIAYKRFRPVNNQQANFHASFENFETANRGQPMTYAQTVRGNEQLENPLLQKIEAMMSKQIDLLNSLMNMMSMLMTKLCK